jgi:hypothetical protein
MTPFDDFLIELDHRWVPETNQRICFRVIGSVALMLQADYRRVTKDGDMLETIALTTAIQDRLLALGGKATELAEKHNIYLDIVHSGLPFLPHLPTYHKCSPLNERLVHFEIEVLDVLDVVVTKLKPFRPNDRKDIEAMADLGLVDPELLVERFRSAMDRASMSSCADDFPKYISNLNRVERDWLYTDETVFDLEN